MSATWLFNQTIYCGHLRKCKRMSVATWSLRERPVCSFFPVTSRRQLTRLSARFDGARSMLYVHVRKNIFKVHTPLEVEAGNWPPSISFWQF